jgi:hypothetical protein
LKMLKRFVRCFGRNVPSENVNRRSSLMHIDFGAADEQIKEGLQQTAHNERMPLVHVRIQLAQISTSKMIFIIVRTKSCSLWALTAYRACLTARHVTLRIRRLICYPQKVVSGRVVCSGATSTAGAVTACSWELSASGGISATAACRSGTTEQYGSYGRE